MKRDIFKKRINYKPFEYPEVMNLVKVINQTYWKVDEIDFTADIQDYHTQLTDLEKEIFKRNLLTISQVEVGVKTFWGNLYNHFPKPEINNLGATFAENECYDKETQVLTNHGFKYFYDLKGDDKIAQYNLSTKEISFVKPLNYIKKPFKGKLHHYYGKSLDLMVTPNHEIIVEHPSSHLIKKAKSVSGVWSRNYITPVAGYKKGNKEFTSLDRLLIAIQADGCLYGNTPSGKVTERLGFSFAFQKNRKTERVLRFLNDLGIKYKISKRQNDQTVINASLKGYVTFDVIEKIKDFSYVNIEDIDANWGMEFLEELKFWDSSIKSNTNYFTYYNAREKAVDKVVEICALSGYRSCKAINRYKEQTLQSLNPDKTKRKSAKDCYALTITRTDKTVYPKRKEIDYDDFVYCVEVPDGCIVVKRGKRVAISGNCTHSEAYSTLLEKLGYNNEFNNIYEIPIFKEKIDLIENSLTGRKDILEKLMFFTIVIENASLFSQFANILSFQRFKGIMKNTSNIINWSSSDEQIHAEAGIMLVNIIKEEKPDYFKDMSQYIIKDVHKYIEYESKLLDWIFEKGELEFYSKEDLLNFMKYRVDLALEKMGFEKQFNITKEQYKPMEWFDEETKIQTLTDFFAQRPVEYSKHNQPFTKDSLF